MAKPTVIWHGTAQERDQLTGVFAKNCQCEYAPDGTRKTTCSVHQAMLEDQRFMDGLVYARTIAQRLTNEEWSTRKTGK